MSFKIAGISCMLCLCACLNLRAQQPEIPSAHQRQLEFYQSTGLESEVAWNDYHGIVESPPNRAMGPCTLQNKVYGWHPYWMGTAYTSYDFSLLSTFSYFSYEVNPNTGNYNSIHSWKTTNSINLAQTAGCRVELCVTLFGGTNNTTFLTNPTARQTLIDSLIVLVNYRNADGVNIDFEGIPGAQRNNFTNFMQDLSTQLKTAIPGASLSMALFAVDWNNVFDIPNLDPYLDEFIIMGYGYHYSGSATAGPTAPLYSGSIWWPYNLNRSVLYYLGQNITPSKLLIGLPYYGNEYHTTAATVPSASNGFVSSRTYSYMRNNYSGVHSRHYDDHSESPAHIFLSGAQQRQSWVDDHESLAEKFDLVKHRNIGGIGIWALGYDNGYTELWDLIEEKFSDCGTPYCADTLYDMGGPLGNYRNNEDYSFTIQSPSGQSVTAEFVAFDLEANFDFAYVYDGPTTAAPLIGQYSGTTAPGTFTSTGDALTFRFTTDGATIASGYALGWACNADPVYSDTIYLDRNDSAQLNCTLPFHMFYDSDAGTGGNYQDNENNTMTFCAPDPNDAVRVTFNMQIAPVQLDIKSTTVGNDYLYIWDGADTTANLKALYTGSTSSYPQPGTVISSGQCMTIGFRSDGVSNGAGWAGSLRCVNPPVNQGTTLASTAAPAVFEDTGGPSANYGNSESYVRTFCPDANATLLNQVIWADFGAITIEQNYDYLHVYDGPDLNARLIGTFTGNDLNENNLQTIKASENNPSGCLTFEFYSDGATNFGGWSALITSGIARKAFGTESCTNATLINTAGWPYAGSTTLATGHPNAEDPPLNIELLSLAECSGANAITRLENTIWYRFNTPSSICMSSQIDLALENISCQNSIPGGNGAQFTLYEAPTCQTGAGWGNPIYCSDKLLQSFPVNIASLLQPSRTYYIMVDGFAGQHCNLDLILSGDINGCILPIELVNFEGEAQEEVVELNWETANEHNNRGFFVQRGAPGLTGDLEFRDIGYVDAVNVPQGGHYRMEDPEYLRDQVNFYRLRQVDLDGVSHFHRVLRIAPPGAGGALAAELYPNPFSQTLQLSFSQVPAQAGYLQLYDLQGQRVHATEWAAGQGLQHRSIDLSMLETGVYLYKLYVDGQLQHGKLVRR